MLLLDTHVLVWLVSEEHRIGAASRQLLDESWTLGNAAVSAMTFWEVALLRSKNQLDFIDDVSQWRSRLLEEGLQEIPVDGGIGIRANFLPSFHADPADRIIVATALAGHQLMTADERILNWNGNLPRMDARE